MSEEITVLPVEGGKKFIINGASVRISDDCKSLEIDHGSDVLTEDHILTEQDATTPARRIYFYLQLMYLDPENVDKFYIPFMDRMIELLQATTLNEVRNTLMVVFRLVQDRAFFEALDACRELVIFEKEVLREFGAAQQAG